MSKNGYKRGHYKALQCKYCHTILPEDFNERERTICSACKRNIGNLQRWKKSGQLDKNNNTFIKMKRLGFDIDIENDYIDEPEFSPQFNRLTNNTNNTNNLNNLNKVDVLELINDKISDLTDDITGLKRDLRVKDVIFEDNGKEINEKITDLESISVELIKIHEKDKILFIKKITELEDELKPIFGDGIEKGFLSEIITKDEVEFEIETITNKYKQLEEENKELKTLITTQEEIIKRNYNELKTPIEKLEDELDAQYKITEFLQEENEILKNIIKQQEENYNNMLLRLDKLESVTYYPLTKENLNKQPESPKRVVAKNKENILKAVFKENDSIITKTQNLMSEIITLTEIYLDEINDGGITKDARYRSDMNKYKIYMEEYEFLLPENLEIIEENRKNYKSLTD